LIQNNKLKEGYKVKITGHIKGKGNGATMEGNTPKQLSEDLVTVLPKGNSPRKVSVIGCRSSKCDNGNRSFVSNLQESLQSKGVTTIVKGYLGAISISLPWWLRCLYLDMSGYFDFIAFF
jgi:hypothetical protein